jgi:hypothetical protein
MTICIAAVCDENTDDRKIILCTDRKISSALGSAETSLKSRTLGLESWRCLTSGSDIDILCTLRLLQNIFRDENNIDETNVLALVRAALNNRKRDKAEELIQGKFGISYMEFLEHGKNRLPDDIFRAVAFEVEQTALDAEFIIVGYGYGYPLLVKTDTNCRASIKEHFAVAGEGAYLAQAALLSRAHNHLMPFGRALYSVFEAKKFSEGAPSVGKSTSITVLHSDGRHELLTPEGLLYFENKYQEFGPKELSEDFSTESKLFAKLKTLPPRKKEDIKSA